LIFLETCASNQYLMIISDFTFKFMAKIIAPLLAVVVEEGGVLTSKSRKLAGYHGPSNSFTPGSGAVQHQCTNG